MSKKTDLIIGAVGGYQWEQIDVWALSLLKSGFSGIGAVIVYDDNETVINNLSSLGFQVQERSCQWTILMETREPQTCRLQFPVDSHRRQYW